MSRLVGTALVAFVVCALIFVLLQAFLTPFGWGMAWGGPMMHMGYANASMWLMGSFFFTLVWLAPFVVVITLIVWLTNRCRDGGRKDGL